MLIEKLNRFITRGQLFGQKMLLQGFIGKSSQVRMLQKLSDLTCVYHEVL